MNTMVSSIRFYFDYESPNAYLAWTQLPKLANRYDYNISPTNTLSVNYTADEGEEVDPEDNTLFQGTQTRDLYTLSVQQTHIFSPRIVNTAMFGASRANAVDGSLAGIVCAKASFLFSVSDGGGVAIPDGASQDIVRQAVDLQEDDPRNVGLRFFGPYAPGAPFTCFLAILGSMDDWFAAFSALILAISSSIVVSSPKIAMRAKIFRKLSSEKALA